MERRVLIYAPRGRDAQVVQRVVEGMGLQVSTCASHDELLARLTEGAAAALLTQEALLQLPADGLQDWLAHQPSWSDFPFIVLATREASSRRLLSAQQALGNVIVLERPVRTETLARATDAAVRQRRRQYATRLHLEQLEDARAEVVHLNAQLEVRITSRTHELATANDRLMTEIAERERAQAALLQAQKMEAIGRLTGGIAHDFNNLLHVVQMNLDLLARVSKEARVADIVSRAKGAVGKGSRLTGQLLSFARNQSLLPRLTDVGALIEGVRELVMVSVGPQVEVHITPSPQPCWAKLDANQLEMAILNLAVNARDAMASGGTLRIATELRDKPGGELPAGQYVAVTVQDTGTGIPAHVIGKVFDPFFTTKAVGSGTGLGLSQVYGFAKQSGGLAFIHSAEGQGTRVEMLFPASDERVGEEPAQAETLDTGLSSGRRHRVLVVEDDTEVRRVIAESLDLLGCTVVQAADGAAGLLALEGARPDLLVVDYAMPNMNGAEFIAQARQRIGDVPVVLATGYADMAEVGRVLGTQSILIKPFDIATLARAVRQALGGGADIMPPVLHHNDSPAVTGETQ
ncbi:MAG: response regulator [Comamonadaceae bacterium]|nr:MAG: response regulator [Comamonadaceae bacterium]